MGWKFLANRVTSKIVLSKYRFDGKPCLGGATGNSVQEDLKCVDPISQSFLDEDKDLNKSVHTFPRKRDGGVLASESEGLI